MSNLIVTEWMSLDGITDATTMAEWFNPFHSDSRAQVIQDTINNCNVMLYGRNTYQMLYPYWSAFKNNEMGVAERLNNAKKYVVSTTLETAPWNDTTIISGGVPERIADLKKEADGNILVQGSITLVKLLIASGLVDELQLLVQPYIVGTGNGTLFNGLTTALELVRSEQLEKGVQLLTYKPVAGNA
ncbi:dihydrofolate reductase family protein [Niabella beijingensis]|uniref:dihydrofolate reductase family protein n=1 Tax=Niabella beijingensis TaxID=2872700 RepID=UPI001CC15393|nr:dihydrofolate reductase family protein [Niabella beijingensis]MBZ4188105.1 dihydrofolate reductase family protein [Niabella beijingensis]